MSKESFYDESDLLALLAGLRVVDDSEAAKAINGEDYWTKVVDGERKARDTKINWDWVKNPKDAWKKVEWRDWLVEQIISVESGEASEFTAVPGPPRLTFDIKSSNITPAEAENSANPDLANIKALTLVDQKDAQGYKSTDRREFYTAIKLGVNFYTPPADSNSEERLIVIGGGFKRRTVVYDEAKGETDKLRFDLEFYIPYFAIAAGGPRDGQHVDVPAELSQLKIGMALTNNSESIGGMEAQEFDMAGLRFYGTAQFKPGKETAFAEPVMAAQRFDLPQKKGEEGLIEYIDQDWKTISAEDWQSLVDNLLRSKYVNSKDLMLKSPLAGATAEKLNYSMVTTFKEGFAAQKRDFKAAKGQVKEIPGEVDKAGKAVKVSGSESEKEEEKAKPLDKDSWQTIGNFLCSLGFIKKVNGTLEVNCSAESFTGYRLSAQKMTSSDFWPVMHEVVKGLDGFPIFFFGGGTSPATTEENTASAAEGEGAAEDSEQEKEKSKEEESAAAAEGEGAAEDGKQEKEKSTEDKGPSRMDMLRAVGELALVTDERTAGTDVTRDFFGVRLLVYNILLKRAKASEANERQIQVLLQLGKFFSGESRDDNWIRRLLPTVEKSSGMREKVSGSAGGLGIYPFSVTLKKGSDATALFQREWRAELASIGLDIQDIGKAGKGLIGTADAQRFRILGIELRGMLALEFLQGQEKPDVTWALGAKADGVRISLAPAQKPEEKKEESSPPEDELLGLLNRMFPDEEEKKPKKPPSAYGPQTGLSTTKAERKEMGLGFGLSFGYMGPLKADSNGTFDVQLYNAAGKRGEIVWIPVDRGVGPFYLKKLGIGLRNVEIQQPKLTLLATGGMRISGFEVGLIESGVSIPLQDPSGIIPLINGMEASFTEGPAVISGRLLRRKTYVYYPDEEGRAVIDESQTIIQYAGSLHIALEGYGLAAMGAYGKLPKGGVTFFLFGAILGGEEGLYNGPFVKLEAIALGFGINRQVVIPTIEGVAEYPLVKMVTGEAEPDPQQEDSSESAQKDKAGEFNRALGGLLDDSMNATRAMPGQYFGAVGIRFMLIQTVDVYALLVAQASSIKNLEITLLGLGRVKEPTGKDVKAIAYFELALLVDINIGEFVIRAQAQLTAATFVLNKSCQITGGFAFVYWGKGENKGDFVISLGGYNPHFNKPVQYPDVPRLGCNWQISSVMRIKAGLYFAITNSAIMAGGRLEGYFRGGPLTASLIIYADFLVQYKPLHYEINVGIAIHIAVDLVLFSFNGTISVDMVLMGQPFHGKANVKVGPISKTITFGDKPEDPIPRLKTWAEFGGSFLDNSAAGGEKAPAGNGQTPAAWQLGDGEKAAIGPALHGLNLVSGKITKPGAGDSEKGSDQGPGQPDTRWFVRGDEVGFSISSTLPATKIEAITMSQDSASALPKDEAHTGMPLVVSSPVQGTPSPGQNGSASGPELGLRPMDIRDMQSPLRVSVVREGNPSFYSHDISDWRLEPEQTGMAGAVWSKEALDLKTPKSEMIPGCLTGAKSFKPAPGGPRGQAVSDVRAADIGWHQEQDKNAVKSSKQQNAPQPFTDRPDMLDTFSTTAGRRQAVAGALAGAGFRELAFYSSNPGDKFRALYATPLAAKED